LSVNLRDRAGAGVDVGTPQLGAQQMAAAEDVQRQIAVTAIKAVEEFSFLIAVQRVDPGSIAFPAHVTGQEIRYREDDGVGLESRPLYSWLRVLGRFGTLSPNHGEASYAISENI
jgi:hypothetical protein